jgi:hypothetical protein
MPRFNGQNKKKIDPRYFAEELLSERYGLTAASKEAAAEIQTAAAKEKRAKLARRKGGKDPEITAAELAAGDKREKARAVHKAAFTKHMAKFEKAGYTGQSLVDNEVWTKAACPKCKYGRDEKGIFKKSTSGVRYFKPDSKAGRQILKAIKGISDRNLDDYGPAVDQGLAEQLTAQKLKRIIKEEARRMLAFKNKIKLNEQYGARGPAGYKQPTASRRRAWKRQAGADRSTAAAEKAAGTGADTGLQLSPKYKRMKAARARAAYKRSVDKPELTEQAPQAANPRLQKLKAKWEAICSKRGMKVVGTGAGSFKCVGEPGQRKGLLPGQKEKDQQLPAVKGLQYRAKGAEVRKLQQLISLAGTSGVPVADARFAAIKPDGSFGPSTAERILRIKYATKDAGGMGLPLPSKGHQKLWDAAKFKTLSAHGLATVDAPTYKALVALAKRGFQKLFA